MQQISNRIFASLLGNFVKANSSRAALCNVANASQEPRLGPKGPVGSFDSKQVDLLCDCDNTGQLKGCTKSAKCQYRVDQVPVYIKTYGCQMNVNDTSIVAAILEDYGYTVQQDESQAEIYLLMTCAIRESAESKIWSKLHTLKRHKQSKQHPLKQIGLLGCMAERLKDQVLSSSGAVDIVAGPDAYRDLPRLFSVNKLTQSKAINCLLSFDETYSDIRPVTSIGDVTSFISITRGCDNLCSYCVVPFTRGRERSRPITTILDEARQLMAKGVKEVTLLGQNVNSYRDLATSPEVLDRFDLMESVNEREQYATGFKTVYKPRTKGLTFDVLLEEVAKLSPELRVRFTSPHPKDFTDQVIDVIRRYPNITRCVHLPAQSGSDEVLRNMRRGYTKEAYLDLARRMRAAVPELTLTSDFIAGFCGETLEDHEQTLDLIRQVPFYSYIYAFPYSQRAKTHAYHKLADNIDENEKKRRVGEILDLFRVQTGELNSGLIGCNQLVLIESSSRRSDECWVGRTEQNIKTIVPKSVCCSVSSQSPDDPVDQQRQIQPGDYVVCEITSATSQTLHALPRQIVSQAEYCAKQMNS